MTVLHSQLNPRSADFTANAAAMRRVADHQVIESGVRDERKLLQ